MRITTNLASRPFTDLGPTLRRLRIAMGVLALVAAAFIAGLYSMHTRAEAVRDRERSLDSNIAAVRLEEQTYNAMLAKPDNAEILEHAATLNRLFDEKGFSWTLAMEDLETVLPGGVQVATLEPMRDKKSGHITLHMRVVGPRDKAVVLVQNLERSRRFVAPRITGEASEAAANGVQQLEPVSLTNRVNFDLLADYKPAAPGERRASNKVAGLEQGSAIHKTPNMLGTPARLSPSRKMVPPHPAPHPGGTR